MSNKHPHFVHMTIKRTPLPEFDSEVNIPLPNIQQFFQHLKKTSVYPWFLGEFGEIRTPHTSIASLFHDPLSAIAELIYPGEIFHHGDIRVSGMALGLTWEEMITIQAASDHNLSSNFYRRDIRENILKITIP